MRQMLPFFSVVMLATACNSNPKTDMPIVIAEPVIVNADTSGLAQFQAWKTQHELATIQQYNVQQAPAAASIQKPVRTSTTKYRTVSTTPVPVQSGSMSSESANTAKAAQKRGWSKAAKGTTIGTGTGAVIGAIITKKNRVAGGVIGGVAGGAVGYGIGRHMDKRDGRY